MGDQLLLACSLMNETLCGVYSIYTLREAVTVGGQPISIFFKQSNECKK
jgi:hypothetical protein